MPKTVDHVGPSIGKLKIFLGYASGVGKTYAMLEDALQRQTEGTDILVGYVDAYYADNQALLHQLDTSPTFSQGVSLDLDSILARKPQVVLIDDLAETNPPSCRHPRRYQDVEELLLAGIDVYTTLNIQYLESLKDVVQQITGSQIANTVPDRLLDMADQIVLVDLPTEDLLQRLSEGKVDYRKVADAVSQDFYRKGNLTALRELAMRRAAKRIDAQMSDYMQMKSIVGPWAATERIAVCVSPSPLSQRLLRTAFRLANEIRAEWFAIYVETASPNLFDVNVRLQIADNLRLAEELGATVITLPGDNVADILINYAKTHNITKMIVGKPLRPRWVDILQGSLVDQLVRKSANIDIYVISSDSPPQTSPYGWAFFQRHSELSDYVSAALLIGLTTAFGMLIAPFISPTNLVMFYLLAVVIAAVRMGRGPALITATLSVMAFNFFFVPPRFTFAVEQAEYLLTFLALFIVGLTIATLAARVREHAKAAQQRQIQTTALYGLSRDLSASADLKITIQAVLTHVSQTFTCEAAIFLPENSHLSPYLATEHFPVTEAESHVMSWAYTHQSITGNGTHTMPNAQARYLPLRNGQNVIGVLGVMFKESELLTPERMHLLEAFASQAALGIDAINLAEKARQTQLLQETERLQAALLNSISHELRTPLVSITGAFSSLKEHNDLLTDEARAELIDSAYDEARRLNEFVGNLLDMTRLEANALPLHQSPCDVQDLIGVALSNIRHRYPAEHRKIEIDLPDNLPLVSADFVLIEQVLTNLLDNAIKYSPMDTPVELCIKNGAMIEISVRDHGMGVKETDNPKIFDKFFRGTNTMGTSGTGLGLSICKGIIEAHGGQIYAKNPTEGGALFVFTLPIASLQVESGDL